MACSWAHNSSGSYKIKRWKKKPEKAVLPMRMSLMYYWRIGLGGDNRFQIFWHQNGIKTVDYKWTHRSMKSCGSKLMFLFSGNMGQFTFIPSRKWMEGDLLDIRCLCESGYITEEFNGLSEHRLKYTYLTLFDCSHCVKVLQTLFNSIAPQNFWKWTEINFLNFRKKKKRKSEGDTMVEKFWDKLF